MELPTGSTRAILHAKDDQPWSIRVPGGEIVAYSNVSPTRKVNEDSGLIGEASGGLVLAVADGMGGQSSGQRASQAAVEKLEVALRRGAEDGSELRHVVLDAFDAANQAVLELGVGAGTTLACALIRDRRARMLHVGDSLVLMVGQRGRIRMQNLPHSPTAYAVEAGLLAESEAIYHEDRHLVTNFVGSAEMHVEVGPWVDVAERDTLLVASDGLSDNLTREEIVDRIRKGPLLEGATRLVNLARERMAVPGDSQPSKADDLTLLLYRRTR